MSIPALVESFLPACTDVNVEHLVEASGRNKFTFDGRCKWDSGMNRDYLTIGVNLMDGRATGCGQQQHRGQH